MIGVGGSDWKHYVRRKPHVVKRRIRKGIPDCLRGLVWQLISGSRDLLLMNPGVYEVSQILSPNFSVILSFVFEHEYLLKYLTNHEIRVPFKANSYSLKETFSLEKLDMSSLVLDKALFR